MESDNGTIAKYTEHADCQAPHHPIISSIKDCKDARIDFGDLTKTANDILDSIKTATSPKKLGKPVSDDATTNILNDASSEAPSFEHDTERNLETELMGIMDSFGF